MAMFMLQEKLGKNQQLVNKMKKNTKIFLLSFTAFAMGVGIYFYMKKPKAMVKINSDGSGYAQFGNQTKPFSKDGSVLLKSFNGFEMTASKDLVTIKRFGKIVSQLNPQDSSSTDILVDISAFDVEKNKRVENATNLVVNAFNPFLNLVPKS